MTTSLPVYHHFIATSYLKTTTYTRYTYIEYNNNNKLRTGIKEHLPLKWSKSYVSPVKWSQSGYKVSTKWFPCLMGLTFSSFYKIKMVVIATFNALIRHLCQLYSLQRKNIGVKHSIYIHLANRGLYTFLRSCFYGC